MRNERFVTVIKHDYRSVEIQRIMRETELLKLCNSEYKTARKETRQCFINELKNREYESLFFNSCYRFKNFQTCEVWLDLQEQNYSIEIKYLDYVSDFDKLDQIKTRFYHWLERQDYKYHCHRDLGDRDYDFDNPVILACQTEFERTLKDKPHLIQLVYDIKLLEKHGFKIYVDYVIHADYDYYNNVVDWRTQDYELNITVYQNDVEIHVNLEQGIIFWDYCS